MAGTSFDNPDFYRSVLEGLPVGVYIVDRNGRVRFWNRGAEQLTGHLAHEALGQSATGHVLRPCDWKGRSMCGEQDPVAATLTNGHAQQFAAYFRHKSGHRVAVRVRSRVLRSRGPWFCLKRHLSSGRTHRGRRCTDASTQRLGFRRTG